MDDVTVLALAARDGDRVALSSFVRQTWTDVARLVTAVAGHDLAEDAAQDAYLRALRALPPTGAMPAPASGCSRSLAARPSTPCAPPVGGAG